MGCAAARPPGSAPVPVVRRGDDLPRPRPRPHTRAARRPRDRAHAHPAQPSRATTADLQQVRLAAVTMTKLPTWILRAWRPQNRLRGPLKAIPPRSNVIVMVTVPDARDGQFDGLMWTCPEGPAMDIETARREILEMTQRFLDQVLPLSS